VYQSRSLPIISSPAAFIRPPSTSRIGIERRPGGAEEDRAMTRLARGIALALLLIALTAVPGGGAAASQTAMDAAAEPSGSARGWVWPVRGARIAAPYAAPAHAYGPGHRGIDLEPRGDAHVRSPADGVVAFSGTVAGRGILTIDHGGGLVTTLEPIASDLHPGDAVTATEEVGEISSGGHVAAGTIHFGVRLNGAYVNPLLLLGGVPRAILLPCCD
jgi:murein DD-endopeptidase MepM/ murein hydrolase activator NlpD